LIIFFNSQNGNESKDFHFLFTGFFNCFLWKTYSHFWGYVDKGENIQKPLTKQSILQFYSHLTHISTFLCGKLSTNIVDKFFVQKAFDMLR